VILLFANGFGATSVPVVSGSLQQSGTLSPLPAISIGGVLAPILFAGLVSPGTFQFNLLVPPESSDGSLAVRASYGGANTQTGVLLAVQH
jgi:uncharacterized protein (TIGR03437 family)